MVHRVSGQKGPALVGFFDELEPVIEVIGGTERPGLLDSSAEGIVAEGCGANTRIHDLRQAVLEVPSEAAALSVGQGIAVWVFNKLSTVEH